MDNSEKIKKFAEEIISALDGERLVFIVFSSFPKGELLKIKGTPKNISGVRVIQFESSLSEGRVTQKNVGKCDVDKYVENALSLGSRNCQLVCTNGTATLLVSSKGIVNVSYKLSKNISSMLTVGEENNNAKNYIFDGKEDFMSALGISDREGRVHDKKQSKFRQINRFAEQVRDIVKYLPKDGKVTVYDLCCGKSYLSFALYYYLSNDLGREVDMICVDIKASVMEYCAATAKKLGYSGMSFMASDITKIEAKSAPDLVVSLHACDTATDIVLDFAVRNRAKVILSTPCCQHEMFNIMNSPELGFISKYSILKQKIASAATDALRLAYLESKGYKTDAIELVDPEETPKNVLLRGILKKNVSAADQKKKEDFYIESYKFMTGDAPSDRT